MNPVRAGFQMSEPSLVLGVMTALFLAFFASVAIWLFFKKSESFDEAAMSVFDDEEGVSHG